MGGFDLVQRVDRRGFLALAAAAVAASSSAYSQTLISGTAEADSGHLRASLSDAQAKAQAEEEARARAELQQGQASQWSQAPAPAGTDWRQLLLRGERSISMRRDGGALVRVRYCTQDGLLDREGYAVACYMLRDVTAGRLAAMDPGLLDLLCGMQRWAQYNGYQADINALSGFRTLQTNHGTEGAALNSLHLYAKAADVVIEGFSGARLGAMAKQFNVAGGNGIYVNRGFVHVDTGRSRTWISTSVTRRSS
ncbi:uncharacterized protein YcbK (DUF882 family) [Roseateles asaccharophilus]|uniref:YcbK family protein n=1 Tax=Roseateles asaccharophilus TaxID=582607 RepID=UPI0038331F98